jgi:hypothetical protein
MGRVWAAATLAAAGLAACGGGGGDGGGSGPTASINTATRVPITRAVAASALTGGIGGSLALASGGQGLSVLPRVLLAGARSVIAREARTAVYGPEVMACDVSGTVSVTWDDRDNDQAPSVGDVLNATFNACSDVAGESLNGGMSATYTQIVPSPLTVGASVSVSALTAVDGSDQASLDGAFAFTLHEVSASVMTLDTVVSNALTMQVVTSAYSDTVTLQNNYTIATTEDSSAVPPGGGTAGRMTTTVSGRLSSAAAGGSVDVSTYDPIVEYTDDEYPRAGGIEALGETGWVRAEALSSTQVRIDIDSTGDGVVDETVTVPWSTLL